MVALEVVTLVVSEVAIPVEVWVVAHSEVDAVLAVAHSVGAEFSDEKRKKKRHVLKNKI